jgi:hypothetical protein
MAQGEGRGEERRPRFIRRQLFGRSPDPPDHAGVLGPGPVDEAGLTDAGGKQLLQAAKGLVDLIQHLATGAGLGRPVAW